MKELYISPELEILCFMPCEGIATDFDINLKSGGNIDNGLSYGETTKPDDYFEGVTTPGGGSNPDGDL